jgi:hypothetical protein
MASGLAALQVILYAAEGRNQRSQSDGFTVAQKSKLANFSTWTLHASD